MKKNIIIASALWFALPLCAQSTFDKFKQQQQQQYNQFKKDSQAEYDAFRKKENEEYAEFMRQAWEAFPTHEAEKTKAEKPVPPVVSTRAIFRSSAHLQSSFLIISGSSGTMDV